MSIVQQGRGERPTVRILYSVLYRAWYDVRSGLLSLDSLPRLPMADLSEKMRSNPLTEAAAHGAISAKGEKQNTKLS